MRWTAGTAGSDRSAHESLSASGGSASMPRNSVAAWKPQGRRTSGTDCLFHRRSGFHLAGASARPSRVVLVPVKGPVRECFISVTGLKDDSGNSSRQRIGRHNLATKPSPVVATIRRPRLPKRWYLRRPQAPVTTQSQHQSQHQRSGVCRRRCLSLEAAVNSRRRFGAGSFQSTTLLMTLRCGPHCW